MKSCILCLIWALKEKLVKRVNKLSWGWGKAWLREIRSLRVRGPWEQGRGGIEEWAGGFRSSYSPGHGLDKRL